ncbi:MAG TPA: hypothetical protein VGK73_17295, partial [Polyangiaceae bacterium]
MLVLRTTFADAAEGAKSTTGVSPAPDPAGEVVRPAPVHTPAPQYPPDGHGDAAVALELTIDRGGVVTDARAKHGEEPFVGAALQAVTG